MRMGVGLRMTTTGARPDAGRIQRHDGAAFKRGQKDPIISKRWEAAVYLLLDKVKNDSLGL
jgi:hypothetical protein